MNLFSKGSFLKLGSGMKGTIPGKVYLSKSETVTYNGNITITYCNGKIFLRSTASKFGKLSVYSTDTLELEKEIKFNDKDLENNKRLLEINKNYPLVSDGNRLFAILTKFTSA